MQTLTPTINDTITGAYKIDTDHTRIGFVARHAMITKVRGSFNEFSGEGFFDADNPANTWLRLTIQAASVDTRNPDRDEHLRSNDFFAMADHPTIDFVSTEVAETGDGEYRVAGDLTIRGVTNPVNLEFIYTGAWTGPAGLARIGFEGRTTVNRKDWGVSWNENLDAGGVLVGDKVTLEFDVAAIRSAD